jgi:hypothetical protein
MSLFHRFLPALLSAMACAGLRAQNAADLKGFAPVSVSSANYRETPREKLLQLTNQQNAINPASREFAPLAKPKYFVFLPGEVFETDLTYEEVCARLTPALAKKNYINGADEQGLIHDPAKVTLILRVSFGSRPWRLPTVRTEQLAWKDGLEPRTRDPRSINNLGGDTIFDRLAGGADNALAAAAENASAGSKILGGGGARGGEPSPGAPAIASGSAASATAVGALAEYGNTREFDLIVVDAFDYAELKAKGKAATRLWTTFVAAPSEAGKKFSASLAALLRSAGPFWGETTAGMQVYNDARAEVKIGEVVEINAAAEVKK